MSTKDKNLNELSFEELETIVDEMEKNAQLDNKEHSKNISNIKLKVSEDKVNLKNSRKTSRVRFKVLEKYGALSNKKYPTIFSKIDWNGYIRYDLRTWKGDMETPNKGITFDDDEFQLLKNLLETFDFNANYQDVLYEYKNGNAHAKIYYNIGTVSTHIVKGETWHKEINIIDWGYGRKIDFRNWTTDYSKCSKGISIYFEEAKKLLSLL